MKKNILYILTICSVLTACSKIDDYKAEFQGEKEISYPGILDSLKVFSGNKRVMVYGLFTSDPKIVKYQVFWNGKQNVIEKTIKRTSGVDTVKLIVDKLEEGGINFEVRTFDDKGNISVPVTAPGIVYGNNYATGIINRSFNPTTTVYDVAKQLLTIDWLGIDPSAIFTTVEYTNTDDVAKVIKVTVNESTLTRISDYKRGTDIFYKTAYRPDPTAIDTFYVAKKDTFKR
ncbi:DUF4998 domain-containing protein [Pedobacter nyackensis]|uniref:DUF4998 domain-containing protein n=1 Tax=Pedobacter nyackensis TaxID=475255 RepID=UPI002931BA98|nr:DUF4998 domain-containing protein [Pedobacter nyackensis]